MLRRQLTQQEIDDYFQSAAKGELGAADQQLPPFDFRRLDRIAKSQLSALHFLHESFVRSLTSSLSVYLRSYVSGNLISVEQLQYADFSDSLPSPTCMVYLSMQPYEGDCVVEINQSLLAPILDSMLGGSGKIKATLDREITDVEADLLEGLFRIITHDLIETWRPVVAINFKVDTFETNPQLSSRIARNEAVVAIAMELRINESIGMLNLAIPSITLKMMRHNFEQQWAVHRSQSPETEAGLKQRLSRDLILRMDCELRGSAIRLRDLLEMEPGDVLDLGATCDGRVSMAINGTPKFLASLDSTGLKLAARIEGLEKAAAF
jgi:flagellar motor switch protein FliM